VGQASRQVAGEEEGLWGGQIDKWLQKRRAWPENEAVGEQLERGPEGQLFLLLAC
jgi:hypothetical protein